jgi:hypothetical protein
MTVDRNRVQPWTVSTLWPEPVCDLLIVQIDGSGRAVLMDNGFKTREAVSRISSQFKRGQDLQDRQEALESTAPHEDQRLGGNRAEPPPCPCQLRNPDPSCRNPVACWSIALRRSAVSIDGWSALLGAGDILK